LTNEIADNSIAWLLDFVSDARADFDLGPGSVKEVAAPFRESRKRRGITIY
jgi:hypothetical protein